MWIWLQRKHLLPLQSPNSFWFLNFSVSKLFVLVYFSVESKRGDGQLTACEVLLFHHEEMGIPWEIAKLGIRQGMWGAVKKIEPGLRAYQRERESSAPLSRCAFMARINTKISANYLDSLESTRSSSSEVETLNSSEEKPRRNIPKLLVIGGAIALACSLDRGLLTKAVIFGVARRFGNIGKKLWLVCFCIWSTDALLEIFAFALGEEFSDSRSLPPPKKDGKRFGYFYLWSVKQLNVGKR